MRMQLGCKLRVELEEFRRTRPQSCIGPDRHSLVSRSNSATRMKLVFGGATKSTRTFAGLFWML